MYDIKQKMQVYKIDVILSVIGVLFTISLLLLGFYKINKFFNTHTFVFQTPVKIDWQSPIYLTLRHTEVTLVSVKSDDHSSPLNETQQYLCDKFGSECRTALAVQRAENGTGQCDRMGFNYGKDGKVSSVDIGYMQINTVHLKKGWTGEELMNCKKNIDRAYEIFKQSGWSPWSAYKNGSYKNYLW